MGKYIDAEKLIKAIENKGLINCSFALKMERLDTLALIDELQQEQQKEELNEETITNEFRIIGDKCFNEGIEGWQREKLIARHFYNLGLSARKEE